MSPYGVTRPQWVKLLTWYFPLKYFEYDDLTVAWNSVDIGGTTQYLQLTTRDWVQPLFQILINEHACLFRSSQLSIALVKSFQSPSEHRIQYWIILSTSMTLVSGDIYILIRVCDSSSGLHGPLIANPSGCLKTMWASHVTSRVKVCLYNEIRTHQPILFPHRSRLVSPAAILSTAMT